MPLDIDAGGHNESLQAEPLTGTSSDLNQSKDQRRSNRGGQRGGESQHPSRAADTLQTRTPQKERSLLVAWEGEGSLELNTRLKALNGQAKIPETLKYGESTGGC